LFGRQHDYNLIREVLHLRFQDNTEKPTLLCRKIKESLGSLSEQLVTLIHN